MCTYPRSSCLSAYSNADTHASRTTETKREKLEAQFMLSALKEYIPYLIDLNLVCIMQLIGLHFITSGIGKVNHFRKISMSNRFD